MKNAFLTDHQNWFGLDENLGPVAISFKREPIEELSSTNQTKAISCASIQYQYRLLVRTSEVGSSHYPAMVIYIFKKSYTSILLTKRFRFLAIVAFHIDAPLCKWIHTAFIILNNYFYGLSKVREFLHNELLLKLI